MRTVLYSILLTRSAETAVTVGRYWSCGRNLRRARAAVVSAARAAMNAVSARMTTQALILQPGGLA
jgi:hypothetical protein